MESKLFEIRDAATFIPVLAVRLDPTCEADRYLLSRSGFGIDAHAQSKYIIMLGLQSHPDQVTYDPNHWPNRTRGAAHQYIVENWDSLSTGDVVDVEFILGESTSKKMSERTEVLT